MNTIKWDYTIPLKDSQSVEKFEAKYAFHIPDDLKALIKAFNAGMPNLDVFDTPQTKGMVIKGLLSFNEDDEESVFSFIKLNNENGTIKMLPFALDPFGNILCIENGKVMFWYHETETMEFVAETVTDFLKLLRQ